MRVVVTCLSQVFFVLCQLCSLQVYKILKGTPSCKDITAPPVVKVGSLRWIAGLTAKVS